MVSEDQQTDTGASIEEISDTLTEIVKNDSVFMMVYEHDGVGLDEIAAETGCSKSTANRIVNKFANAGLIQKHKKGRKHTYTLSLLGRQLVDWLEEGRNILEQRQLYAALSPNVSLPRWLLQQGSVQVVTDTGVSSEEVLNPIFQIIERNDRIHIVLPALTDDRVFYHLANEILNNGTTVEMVLSEQLLETLRIRFPDEMKNICSESDCRIFELHSDANMPYGFGIGQSPNESPGDEVAIVCYDEQFRRMTGSVLNQTPQAVEWAQNRYARHRPSSTDRTEEILRNGYSGSLDEFSFDRQQ